MISRSVVAQRAKRGAQGFSLIEVLVALALLALVAGVGLEAFGGALGLVRRADDTQRWVQVAQSQLALVRASQQLAAGAWSGETVDGVRWVVTLSPLEVSPSQAGLLRAEVRVSGDGGGSVVQLDSVVARVER